MESEEPQDVWATNGITFWALFSAMLVKLQPESVLEFGGGRSTTFLADYAFRFGKSGLTIEQSEAWHQKILSDLRLMNVSGYDVHHVPLEEGAGPTGWYEFTEVQRLIGDRTYELVFIDGPVGDGRRNERGQEIIREASRDAKLIIVDDVQREHNMTFFDSLTESTPARHKFIHDYETLGNLIAFGVSPEWKDQVARCFRFFGLTYTEGTSDGGGARLSRLWESVRGR
ncbi:MAG TPA: hypothetical protein VHQ97_00315 [Solirubrobacterales bacterium]|jgi:hypothetical protein|nr:hypothetical protein [Solirubrobacterales bacterium]